MKAGIINVTGYAGIELARLLWKHPHAELVSVTGRSAAGEDLGDYLPHLSRNNMPITEEITGEVDVVFSALPQVASAEACLPYIRDGVKV
ncbi:MAG: N-acetyl-gamma-glutamyl-phosphate reductase, partial [Dehalococcoidia bacterium]